MSIEIEPIGGATSGTNWTRSGNTYNNTGQFSSILIPILPLTSGKIYFEYEFTSGGPFGFFINIQRPPTRSGNYHDGAAGNGNGGESALRWAPSAPGSTRYSAVIDIDNATLETIGYSGVQTLAGTGDIYLGVYDCTSSNIGSGTLYFKESEFINPIPSGATAWYETLNDPGPPVYVDPRDDPSYEPPIIDLFQVGSDLTIILNTLGGETPGASQPNGTVVPYTISGNYITEDKIGNPLTGNFVLTNNTDEITISVLTIPSTTLTFTAFGETVTYDIIYPTALEGDVTEVPITFNLGYYKTLPVQQLPNGISMSDYEWVSNGAVDNYKTGLIIPEELFNNIPISMSDYEWISNGVINNYKFNTPITGNFSTIEPYRVTTVSSGGRMNVFTVNPLGAEIINETWY